MALLSSNRDFDSTLIVLGIHLLLGGVICVDVLYPGTDLSSLTNNLIIIYGMVASYFFKSQSQSQKHTGSDSEEKAK